MASRSARCPSTTCSQFHKKYNPDADKLAKSQGFNSWADLFLNRSGADTLFQAAGLPVLRPWLMQTTLGTGSRLVFERNPLFYKVDQNGSQLPYIDRVVFDIIEDPQVMLLKATNGEINYQLRHINTPQNKPVLARNAKEKGYTLENLEPSTMNEGVIALNLTIADPVKREIYNNKAFRIGLSHAINRTDIINAVYQRQSEPWQAAPRTGTTFYDEKMAKQYTEFDVDLANQFLDDAGYKNRNFGGIRLGPDGKPIQISFLASTTGGSKRGAADRRAGRSSSSNGPRSGSAWTSTAMERSLFITRTRNQEQDALMWTGFGGHPLTIPVDPRWYLPIVDFQSNWAGEVGTWYLSNGDTGEAPPDDIQTPFKHYRDALATPDEARARRAAEGSAEDRAGRLLRDRHGAVAADLCGARPTTSTTCRDPARLLALSVAGQMLSRTVLHELSRQGSGRAARPPPGQTQIPLRHGPCKGQPCRRRL